MTVARLLLAALLLAAPAGAQTLAPAPAVATAPSAAPIAEPPVPQRPCARVLDLDLAGRSINRGTVDWASSALDAADEAGDVCAVVLRLGATEGDLLSASALATRVALAGTPLLVLVPPDGAATSGPVVLAAQAAHVLALGPGSTFGDAGLATRTLPPGLGGMDAAARAEMEERSLNELVRVGRQLAELRGRNPDWVEAAIRQGATVGADEGVAAGAADVVARDLGQLLLLSDGRVVRLAGQRTRLAVTGATVEPWAMSPQHRVLAVLASPSAAFLFLVVGLAGLWLEWQTPGLIIPGVVGGLSLLLFGLSLSIIPVNLIAVALVLAGFAMVVADLYVTSFAALTIGGVAAVALGGFFLVDQTPTFAASVSLGVIVGVVLFVLVLAAVVGALFVLDRSRPVHGGAEGMIGEEGVVKAAIPGGREAGAVLVHGERWAAVADERISAGARVVVESVDGLQLTVRKES